MIFIPIYASHYVQTTYDAVIFPSVF